MYDPLKRFVFVLAGVACVGVAAVGAFLPGIPTLGPLLLGSLLLVRSHPALEKRLVRNRFFAPYLPYIDGEKELSTKAKLAAGCMMWTSISISTLVMAYFTSAPKFVLYLMPASGLIGSFAIWRWGKNAKPSHAEVIDSKGKSADET